MQNIKIYLYDSVGAPCNRQVPLLSTSTHLPGVKLLRASKTFELAQVSQLKLCDVILFPDQMKGKSFDLGIVAFTDIRKSRIESFIISSTLNDILLLNAPDGANVTIYMRNDFKLLTDGLTIVNIIDYERDILIYLDKRYRVTLL